MKVHIFDPQLNRIDGHYVNYDDAIVTELRQRGIPTIIYGSVAQSSSVGSSLSVQPLFRRGLFDEVLDDPFTWPLDSFVRLGTQFHLDMSTIDQAQFAADDLALFPNILQYQIEGVRGWLLSLPAERRPRVAIKLGWLTFAMPHYQHRTRPSRRWLQWLVAGSWRQCRRPMNPRRNGVPHPIIDAAERMSGAFEGRADVDRT